MTNRNRSALSLVICLTFGLPSMSLAQNGNSPVGSHLSEINFLSQGFTAPSTFSSDGAFTSSDTGDFLGRVYKLGLSFER